MDCILVVFFAYGFTVIHAQSQAQNVRLYQYTDGNCYFKNEVADKGLLQSFVVELLTSLPVISYAQCLKLCQRNILCLAGEYAVFTNLNTHNCWMYRKIPSPSDLNIVTDHFVFYKAGTVCPQLTIVPLTILKLYMHYCRTCIDGSSKLLGVRFEYDDRFSRKRTSVCYQQLLLDSRPMRQSQLGTQLEHELLDSASWCLLQW